MELLKKELDERECLKNIRRTSPKNPADGQSGTTPPLLGQYPRSQILLNTRTKGLNIQPKALFHIGSSIVRPEMSPCDPTLAFQAHSLQILL